MVLLTVRGLLRRPSHSGSPAVTFCSVHIHNIVATKRDASTDVLRRLHGYMHQHNVDFIGGDFTMSAFSTVGDVFSDPEFADTSSECTGSSLCPSAHMNGESTLTAATSTTTPSLASGPVIKQLIFLFSSISALATYLAPTASCAVSERNKEGLSADTTNMSEGRDDVLDRDVVHQSHVSAYLSTSFASH